MSNRDALRLYIEEDYEGALEKLEGALEEQEDGAFLLNIRAMCLMKLGEYVKALEDCSRALEVDSTYERAYLTQGKALFALEEFESARESFETGQKKTREGDRRGSEYARWLRKCALEIEEVDVVAAKEERVEERKERKEKLKHQYYQSQAKVTVDVLKKGLSREDVRVTIEGRRLVVETRKDGEECRLEVRLAKEVDVDRCSWRVTAVKVEVSLAKKEAVQWVSLGEEVEEEEVSQEVSQEEVSQVSPYASTRDWERIDKKLKEDLEEDEKEGEAALNALFQQIYRNADEDTRRAMNKSFATSGGTVLSTNWSEVKEKDYEGKDRVIPEGSEWRSYDGEAVEGGKKI